jgi:hypothetical protein
VSLYIYIHEWEGGTPYKYVGKGVRGRAYDFRRRNQHYLRVVAKYGKPQVWVFPCKDEADAFEQEKHTIAQFKADGVPLLNQTDGGEGTSGWVPTEEYRAKIGAISRARFSTPEARAALSEQARALMSDPAMRANIITKVSETLRRPEARAAARERARAQMSDPAMRAKLSAITRAQMSDPVVRANLSEKARARLSTPEARASNPMSNPAMRAKHREALLRPEVRADHAVKNWWLRSNLPGVHMDKSCGGFRSRIKVNGRPINIGSFPTASAALAAYLAKFREVHGVPHPVEFARIERGLVPIYPTPTWLNQ